jgi:hypothetical protein
MSKKIKIEMDMIHFTMIYHYLSVAHKSVKDREGLNFLLFQEAFNDLDRQFSEQYTDEHGEEFEHQHELREIIYKINKK